MKSIKKLTTLCTILFVFSVASGYAQTNPFLTATLESPSPINCVEVALPGSYFVLTLPSVAGATYEWYSGEYLIKDPSIGGHGMRYYLPDTVPGAPYFCEKDEIGCVVTYQGVQYPFPLKLKVCPAGVCK